MQFSSLPINSSLQNNPRYQFSLKSENIEILSILSAAILKIKMTLNAIFIITKIKMATIANQRWISIRNIIIYLETKFRPNRRIFVFWRQFWIQNGCRSKPTMDINSEHHNLFGNQILSKSENFCILASILDSKWSP